MSAAEQGDHIAARMSIFHAMDELMESTPLDKLTVTEICRKAGISRHLFYQCFQDKYDVVAWALTEVTRPTVRQIGIAFGWYEGFLRLHRALLNMKAFITHAAASNDVNALPAVAQRLAKEDYERAVRLRLDTDEIPELLSFQMECFALTATYVTTRWQTGGMVETPEKISSMLITLVPRELFELLDIPPESQGEWTVMGEFESFSQLPPRDSD